MRRFYSTSALLILTTSLTINCWATNPCKPIALECMAEGYFKGGAVIGKELIKSCVIPVVMRQKTLQHNVIKDDELQECKASLKENQSIAMD